MEHLATPAFEASTMASFDKLDVNGSEKLEAAELAPVIVDMIGNIDDSGPMDLAQCMNFVGLVFDQDGDGVISRAEWFHLVEFVVVMNVLEASKNRTITSYLDNSFAEASNSPDRKRTESAEAEAGGRDEGSAPTSSAPKSRVTSEMRGQIHDEVLSLLSSPEFVDNCMATFDSNGEHRKASKTLAPESKQSYKFLHMKFSKGDDPTSGVSLPRLYRLGKIALSPPHHHTTTPPP